MLLIRMSTGEGSVNYEGLHMLQKFIFKTILYSTIIFSISCGDSAPANEQNTKNVNKFSDAPSIIFLGDSLTAGRGVCDYRNPTPL